MDFDLTLVFQMGILLVLLGVLNGLVLRPTLDVIVRREKCTEGALAEAESLRRQGDDDRDAYQQEIREAGRRAQVIRDALVQEGREMEKKLLQDARQKVLDSLGKARGEIANERSIAQSTLDASTHDLARELTAKFLGREV